MPCAHNLNLNDDLIFGAGHISPRVTIEALPDEVLLDIFDFYRLDTEASSMWHWAKTWCKLVHVCQRWRYLVFAYPLRLDLRLLCRESTPVGRTLDVWPPLPIIIWSYGISHSVQDDVITALRNPNRVHEIILNDKWLRLKRFYAVMREPFPALECLHLWSSDIAGLVLPNTFLGGSAPRLRSLYLERIPFPTLPRLLLSCSDLVYLQLYRIPYSGYISPETMATGVSTLTKLTWLDINFESEDSRPHTRSPPPLTHAILPALTRFRFQGFSEYLEDFVARINAPLLDDVRVILFRQLEFDLRQLSRFISHTPILTYNRAVMHFCRYSVGVSVGPPSGIFPPSWLRVPCRVVDRQVSSMAQICRHFAIIISGIARLDIKFNDYPYLTRLPETHFLQLFGLFTALRTLCIVSHKVEYFTMSALRGLVSTEVFPALDDLYLLTYHPSKSEQQDTEPFIIARQYPRHPVTVYRLNEMMFWPEW
jgi:F-box-like